MRVVQDIARSAAGTRRRSPGPLLVVPFTRTVQETQLDAARLPVTVTREVSGELHLLPATWTWMASWPPRSASAASIARGSSTPRRASPGRFDVPAHYGVAAPIRPATNSVSRAWSSASATSAASATRCRCRPMARALPSSPARALRMLGAGVQAPLALASVDAQQPLQFQIDLSFAGHRRFPVHPGGPRDACDAQFRLAASQLHRAVPAARARDHQRGLFGGLAHLVLCHQPGGGAGPLPGAG